MLVKVPFWRFWRLWLVKKRDHLCLLQVQEMRACMASWEDSSTAVGRCPFSCFTHFSEANWDFIRASKKHHQLETLSICRSFHKSLRFREFAAVLPFLSRNRLRFAPIPEICPSPLSLAVQGQGVEISTPGDLGFHRGYRSWMIYIGKSQAMDDF